mgnify:CR=1 FL=1
MGLASWIQLFGLMILFVGTGVYNGSFGEFGANTNTNNSDYQSIDSDDEYDNDNNNNNKYNNKYMKTPLAMSSPSLSHSPLIYKPRSPATTHNNHNHNNHNHNHRHRNGEV